jgi:hypothetical protein
MAAGSEQSRHSRRIDPIARSAYSGGDRGVFAEWQRRTRSRAGCRKRHEEAVAGMINFFPAVGGEEGAEGLVVPPDEICPCLVAVASSWVDRAMSVNMNVRISARTREGAAACAGAALACASAARATSRTVPRRSKAERAAASSRAAVSGSPAARYTAASAIRARAVSYEASNSCHRGQPARRLRSAPALSPDRELVLATHALGDRLQRGGPVHGGDGLELVDRGAGPFEVARGQCDLHLRAQEVAPGEAVQGFVGERGPDRRARGLHLALCQAETRETGLRVPAHLARLPERFLAAVRSPILRRTSPSS